MYRIIGADGKIYGPVSAEQLRQWLAEGRADAQTQTLAEGAAEWKPLVALPELAALFTATPPPVIGPPQPAYPAIGQIPQTIPVAANELVRGICPIATAFHLIFWESFFP